MNCSKTKEKSKTKLLPYYVYTIPPLFLVLFGLLNATFLSYSHYQNYSDPTYSSFCSISKTINCDTVAQSPWSIFASLPVAYWGLLGYFFLLILLIPASTIQKLSFLWTPVFLLSCVYSILSILLGYISANKINAYCILCIFSSIVNFSVLYYSWLIQRRFCSNSTTNNLRQSLSYLKGNRALLMPSLLVVTTFVTTWIMIHPYWLYTNALPDKDNVPSGITENFHPWIGAENPVITIHEYSDYMCFQCAKTHAQLRNIVADKPTKIRLVHHHYPLDHEYNPIIVKDPFHIGSGKMSLMAIHAATQGKFWEMNDTLYELARSREPFNTKFLSEKTGISSGELVAALSEPSYRKVLNRDIKDGMKKRIMSTPTFLIKETLYSGYIPPEILQDALK